MKPLRINVLFLLLGFIVGCSGLVSTTDSSKVYNAFEKVTGKSSAKISREDGWTVVSTTVDGDRVYWFLAPDVDQVSPALFKKTVRSGKNVEQDSVIVSECEAPKQKCELLFRQFEALSEKYK